MNIIESHDNESHAALSCVVSLCLLLPLSVRNYMHAHFFKGII